MRPRLVRTQWGLLFTALSLAACSESSKKYNLNFPHHDRQLIVTLESEVSSKKIEQDLGYGIISSESLSEHSHLLRFLDSIDLEQVAPEISQISGVKAVEANLLYRLDEIIPNDQYFTELYGLKNTGQQSGVLGADIRATHAWEMTTGDKKVLVGMIDSGVDYNHPDLKDNIWLNPGENGRDDSGQDKRFNGIDDDNNGHIDDFHGWDFYNSDNDPMDEHGHGTHVSGIVGASGQNNTGITGVNWQVSMVPIKVFSARGESSTDILIRGIDYATKLRVIATNNSWGGGAYSQSMLEAIQRHTASGSLFIAAAGNEGTNNDSESHYPSSYPLENMISVASSNRNDKLSGFSNYGKKTVFVAAPGEDIYSTLPGDAYGIKSGTSMATPYVTGLVALIKALYPSLDARAIKANIGATAARLDTLAEVVSSGRIDAASALEHDSVAPGPIHDLRMETIGINSLKLSWLEAGDDVDAGRASRYQVKLSQIQMNDEEAWNQGETVQATNIVRRDGRMYVDLAGLSYNQTAFVNVRAIDNVGNLGVLSAGLKFLLQPVQVLLNIENDHQEDWEQLEMAWGLSQVDQISVLSDSPSGQYESRVDSTAITREICLHDTKVILDVRSRWSMETSYDFAFLELSSDRGETWQVLRSMTGDSGGWVNQTFSLASVLGEAKSFRLRLRMQTDFSVNADGLDVDALRVIGAAESVENPSLRCTQGL